jgi:hypothetical protein
MTLPDDRFPHLYPRENRAVPRHTPEENVLADRWMRAITDGLPLNALERSVPELQLVIAVLHLVHVMRFPYTEHRVCTLAHIGKVLGIDLPEDGHPGEAPR